MSRQLVEYDPRWPEYFESESTRLRGVLGPLAVRVDHIGSTAVPGLPAKPIIDMQIVVRAQADVPACRTLLLSLGYSEATAPIYFFHRPATWPHSHHVHVRQEGSFEERRLRLFRDWLRANPNDCDAYGALKRELARGADLQVLEERVHYSEGKTAFVREIERRLGLDDRGSRSD